MRVTVLARRLKGFFVCQMLFACAALLMIASCASSSLVGSRTVDTAPSGPSMPQVPSRGESSSSAEVLGCPYVPSMCPMIYAPVRCSLVQGEKVVTEIDAENGCMGILRLREIWCPRLQKAAGGAETAPSGGHTETVPESAPKSVSVRCAATGGSDRATPDR